MIALWLLGSMEMLGVERAGLRQVPGFMRAGYEEKKLFFDGPVWGLAKKAAGIIPPKSRVFYFNPSERNESYYYLKMRYYLYPLIVKGGELKISRLSECDYLIFQIPDASGYRDIDLDRALPFLEKKYEFTDGVRYEAIYLINKGEDR